MMEQGYLNGLNGKNVLLITSVLFNYQDMIKKQLEREGAIVHWYDGRNNPSSVEKIIIRVARPLLIPRIYRYYCSIVDIEKNFVPDYIFFVSPEALTGRSLIKLKKSFPKAKIILYMWDSIKNKHIRHILSYFDELYSFDIKDCKKYGMKHRPLFYAKDFMRTNKAVNYKYDVSFVGTLHSDRAKVLYDIKEFCDMNGISYYFYLYVPGKFLLELRKLFTKYMRKWNSNYIHTKSLTEEEVADIATNTRCVIDINHPKQSGLTMRTIEILGLKNKLITTNESIKDYDFYRPENQIVINRKNIQIDKRMLYEKYTDIPENIYKRYSLEVWIREVFALTEE